MTKDEAREILQKLSNGVLTFMEAEAIDCAIQALGEGWVSVEEYKPKNNTLVLVFNGENVFLGVFDGYYEGEPEWTDNNNNDIKPTHWMPLPSPPKPKQP